MFKLSCPEDEEAPGPAARAARSGLQLALHAHACSSHCTLSVQQACCTSRDPLRDEIREVGRGISLADTQTLRRAAMCGCTQDDGYVRGVAPTQNPPSTLSSLFGTRKSTARGFTLSVDLSLAELRHGNRTQNSRVSGPTSSPAGIWSLPRARLGPVRNPVL